MTSTAAAPAHLAARSLRAPVAWGAVFGVLQVASPLAFPWLDAGTVYALGIPLIAAVYIGFAVADGRPHVLAVESTVVAAFVVVAAAARDRVALAGRRRPGRPRRQGHLAAPHPVRRRHPLVAAVLRRRRLRRRRAHRARDHHRRSPSRSEPPAAGPVPASPTPSRGRTMTTTAPRPPQRPCPPPAAAPAAAPSG